MYTPSIHLNTSIKTDYMIFLKKNAKMHGIANSNRIENEKIGGMAGKFSELLLELYGKSGTFVDFCNGKTIPAKRSES